MSIIPKTVKYQCKKCWYSEPLKWYNYIFYNITVFFVIVGLVTTGYIGYIWFTMGVMPGSDFIFEGIESKGFTAFAVAHSEELRDVALNLTYPCSGSHSHCYAHYLYYNLKDIRYVPSQKNSILYDPLYVLDKGGNCRNTAVLYVSLIRSLGLDAEVVCSVNEKHCVSKVPVTTTGDNNYDSYLVVDLSNSYFVELNATQDLWEYDDQQEYIDLEDLKD